MKCQHNWEKITETTLPSGYEQMQKGNIGFDRIRGMSLFQKKYIVVLSCNKCGELKKFVESNPS